jgi:hypothetical protein
MNSSISKSLLCLSFVLFSFYSSKAQTSNKILSSDLALALGQWEGSLTYLDYTSGKPY